MDEKKPETEAPEATPTPQAAASDAPADDKPKNESNGTPGVAPSEGPVDPDALGEKVVDALKSVYDPEIPVNIFELGMIYKVDVSETGNVDVTMTLTSPMCPVAGSLPGETETKVARVEGVRMAKIDLVWEPPWNPEMMSEAAKLQLGM